jgi:hypothetical protein
MTGDRLKAMWDELTPQERATYEAQLAAQAPVREIGKLLAPIEGDLCTAPDATSTAPPFMVSSNTTGAANDYDLESPGANADCGSGQTTFGGTGAANDLTYGLQVDVDCTLQIDADPTGTSWDLALYVVQTSCTPLPGFVNAECIALDDNGGSNVTETVTINATTGNTYFVIVDGFNTAVGTFDLTVSEVGATGCNLVPVELTSFSID